MGSSGYGLDVVLQRVFEAGHAPETRDSFSMSVTAVVEQVAAPGTVSTAVDAVSNETDSTICSAYWTVEPFFFNGPVDDVYAAHWLAKQAMQVICMPAF